MSVQPKPRFNLDTIVHFVDRYPASPLGSIVLSALLYRRARNGAALGCSFLDYLALNKSLRYFLTFVLLKTLNRAVTRWVVNHGWRADPPRWSAGREIVVITGGSTGIGAEMVKRLMKRTHKIAIIDLNPPDFSSPARFYRCDVTNEDSMREVAGQIRSDLGDPTIVIANAGIILGRRITDTTGAQFLKVLKVNTIGAFLLIKEFLPAIVKANHGHFVTVGSSASYMSIAQNGEYSASKAATLALHETLVQELYYRYHAPRVRTTFVGPTKVATPLGQTLKDIDLQFLAPTITTGQVADAVVRQIDSGLSGHLLQPFYANFLPHVRSAPEWFRWLMHAAGKTYETVTDHSADAAKSVHHYKVNED